MVKVSVIIPIYGVEKYLKEAIDSVLFQTLNDLEIILIDDGSKDCCPAIIDEYAAKDSRIIAIHKKNKGYGHSCNIGIERASGEYVAIMEPDDFIEQNMYEDLYNIAKKYDSDIVKSTFFDNLQSTKLKRIKQAKINVFIPEDKSFTIQEFPYFIAYHPSIWSCIYKKDFLQKHNIKFVEAPGAGWTDNPFQIQTMCLAKKINYTSKAYYYWRRINFFDSDDLKDYTIPFKRTDEIHDWLKINNITDENIIAALYKKELAYIKLILGMKKIYNIEHCFSLIRLMLKRMNIVTIENNSIFSLKDKIFYQSCLKSLKKQRRKILLKRFIRSIF